MRPPLAVLLGCLFAAPSHAVPVIHYTWGPPDGGATHQAWAGPMTYTQTLSVTGLEGEIQGLHVTIWYGPHSPAATEPDHVWHMLFPPEFQQVSPPRLDCTGAPGFTVQPAVANAVTIPGSVVTTTLQTFTDITRPLTRGILELTLAMPPMVADPATRYAIATLEYHLENAEPGAASPLLCDNADQGFCWIGMGAYVYGGAYPVWANESLTWQDLATPCWQAATPAKSPTWGSVKQLYR